MRAEGIEPSSSVWKTDILPLNYARNGDMVAKNSLNRKMLYNLKMSVLSKIIFAIVALIVIVGLLIMSPKTIEIDNPLVTEKQQSTIDVTVEKTVDKKQEKIKPITEIEEIITQPAVKQIDVVSPPPEPEQGLISLEELNGKARLALVNVLCTTKWSGPFDPITGSGIIIDPKGVILTNAHVAQYYLLKDYSTKDFLDCVIRTGSPASPAYKADLIFISPTWIKNNYKNITSTDPQGTGESDLALLLIKSKINSAEILPASFPFIAPDYEEESVSVKTPVLLAGYPAGFLGGITIQKDLWPVSAGVSILEIFTYSKEPSYNIDIFSIGGSIVAQKGSSGGAVASQKSGKLLGIIVTSTEASDTGGRNLRAISIAHIGRTLSAELGFNLSDLLSAGRNEIESVSQSFQEVVAPSLTKILTDELDK